MRRISARHIVFWVIRVIRLFESCVLIAITVDYRTVIREPENYRRAAVGVWVGIVAEADTPANRDVIGAAVGLEATLLKSGAETPLRLGLLPGLLAPGLVAGVEVRELNPGVGIYCAAVLDKP